jgi:PTS system mannose-specific IIA component
MIKAVLVTHGFLGAELIRTVEGILGPQEGVGCVSNTGTSLDTLTDQVRELLSRDQEPVLLFVDLVGGSCSHACQQIRALHKNVVVIAGVNLPMLLDFFYNRDLVPLEELAGRLLEKGKEGIRCL